MATLPRKAALLRRAEHWPVSTVAQRLEDCRLMLSIHGYLRPSESDRIQRKIHADVEKGM